MQFATLPRPAYGHWNDLETVLRNVLQNAHRQIHQLIRLGSELTNEKAKVCWGRVDDIDRELNLVRARINTFNQQDVQAHHELASWETLMDALQAQLTESTDTVAPQKPAYS